MLLLQRSLLAASLLFGLCSSATPNLPFGFQELFTVQLSVGKILRPLDVPGGTLVNEPITGGTVNGPALNGTIISGFAHPSFYGNGTLQVNVIDVYGLTDDGKTFYINQQGIGFGTKQVSRIAVNIGTEGDKYDVIRDAFILATINPNANKTAVSVLAYIVTNELP
ncbi:hypothetical protein H2200_008470 [Cladophialophora chaetospira]|uniref:Uncharacterized protein n=1 Tax=Cladophialophora chaetospira TaxID=386627 RepID=A0AA38X606_9EURO|nr:hypothetical protein H2200_008470 [Cladophialophora chaetospira]